MGNCLSTSEPNPQVHTPSPDATATANCAATPPSATPSLPISSPPPTPPINSAASPPPPQKTPPSFIYLTSPTIANFAPTDSSKQAPEPPSTSASLPSTTHPSDAPFKAFISHAGEDKTTIAIPLREKLQKHGVTSFVDMEDMPVGTEAEQAMIHAMQTASVGVFVMSPEFVARKWPMKELMHFLKRHDDCKATGLERPTIIPFFYRLSIPELYDEPRLDRNDKDGNNLYEESRFYERQAKGEPEANIAGIKATLRKLHGIMGLENFVNASNDNTYKMRFSREKMLEELAKRICEAVPESVVLDAITGHEGEAARDNFQPHFDKTDDVSDLVFDFDRKDNNGVACTQEGNLLEMVLDTCTDRNRAIAVRGIGGVGKTSLLRKIRSLNRVVERFKDGMYSIEIGRDATREGLKQALISAVLNSGGKQAAKNMRVETDMRKIIQAFRDWFSRKQCLFVIDDVWNTTEVTRGIIHDLWNLHTSGQDSKILLTTRSIDIATYGRAYVTLKPCEPLEDESRAILYHYASPSLKPDNGEEVIKAVDEILERCAGLPLFLSVAGKGVKTLSFRPGHEGCLAYRIYADQLKTSMSEMITTETESHEGLSAGLRISLDLVEERKKGFDFGVRCSVAEMHRRLSVMKKQMRVPMSMLKNLWGLEHKSQAARISKEFEQVALADVEFEKTEHGAVEVLRLHDSVYEFAVFETKRCQEGQIGHNAIVEGYANGLKTSGRVREWWSKDLEDDKYIHRNICRHMVGAGREEELFRLLLSPKWLDRQVDLNGVGVARGDFSLGIEARRAWKEKLGDREQNEVVEALEMIKEAITLSRSYIVRNPRELWFQVHGRLRRARECSKVVREYLSMIESDAVKPGALCMNELLIQVGGANTGIIPVGGNGVQCMALIEDGERVACGCGNGDIAIVNVHRSEIEVQWRAHNEEVVAIDVGSDGTQVVSSSEDKTVKVWNAQNSDCLSTFDGHNDEVTCVSITRDGKRVVSGSRTVQVWELESGRRMGSPIYPNFDVEFLAMFRDGKHAVVGGWDGELEIWNATTNAKVGSSFYGHTDTVRCAALTPDESRLVTGSRDHAVRLWDVETRQQIGDSFEGHTQWVRCVATSDDGRRVVSGSDDKTIRVWDIESGEQVCDPLNGHTDWITGVSFMGEGDTTISCSLDGTVRVWNLKRQRKERVIDGHDLPVRGICFTPDGTFMVSGSIDGTLRVWDAISRRTAGEPMENFSAVNGVAITPDGLFVVSVSVDKKVRLWDLQTREVVRTFEDHTDPVWCVAVTPDGERVVTGSEDGTVRIWNIKSTEQSHVVLEGHITTVWRVFVSDDGKRIFSVDYEDNIFVWGIEAQTEMKRMTKENARRMSRKRVLGLAGEATVHDEAGLSILLGTKKIAHGEGSEARVLGTLESNIWDWDISPDKQTICVGLADGRVGFLKLAIVGRSRRREDSR